MLKKTHDFGVIYLAFGTPYLAMALRSLASLKKTNPTTPATIVTNAMEMPPNQSLWTDQDNWIYVDSNSTVNRNYKTSINVSSVYDKTLYLDCDTIVTGDISLMSFYLDHFDLAARSGRWPGPRLDRQKRLFDGAMAFSDLPFWNSGVMGFRNTSGVRDFFDNWNALYKQLGFKRDQPSLAESAIRSQCRILSLEPRWNFFDSLSAEGLFVSKSYREKVLIWHYKRDMDPVLQGQIREIAVSAMPSKMDEIDAYLRGGDKASNINKIARRVARAVRGRLA